MKPMILIRHTKPDVLAGLCYGHLDVPFLRQDFADFLLPIEAQALPAFQTFSSPSSRCRDLALRQSPGPVCIDERLMELHFGEWEGRLWDDIPRAASEAWMSDYQNVAPPGGETLRELILRVKDFALTLQDESQLIFTHAGVIRVLLLAAYQEKIGEFFTRTVSYGSIWNLPRRPLAADFEKLLS